MVAFFDDRKNFKGAARPGPKQGDAPAIELGEATMAGGGLTPEQIKDGVEFIRRAPINAPINELRELFNQRFGESPIPKEIVDGVVYGSDARVQFNMVLLSQLAKIRGAEMLPWIEPLLRSEDPRAYGNAARGLLHIDEARGIKESERLYELCAWTAPPDSGFPPFWLIEELKEIGTAACLDAVKRLEALRKHMIYVRYGVTVED